MPETKKRWRLRPHAYDEVSLVDAGANQDSHVLIFKRDVTKRNDIQGGASPSTNTKKSPKKKSQSGGTSTRAANWDESKHPRGAPGSGAGGEWAPTSAASKEKYGKGGTAKDNLPPSARPAKNSDLAQGITPAQQKLLDDANAKSGAAAAKKANNAKLAAAKKAAAAKKKAAAAKVAAAKKKAAAAKAAARAAARLKAQRAKANSQATTIAGLRYQMGQKIATKDRLQVAAGGNIHWVKKKTDKGISRRKVNKAIISRQQRELMSDWMGKGI